MAQLHHVVGAILRDIAQARVTSDLYSREVARYYEEDSLLRVFPIPRTEIKQAEIDLKFAIAGVVKDTSKTEEKFIYVARIFDRYAERISNRLFERLRGEPGYKIHNDAEWMDLVQKLDTMNARADVRLKISNYLETNLKTLVSEETSSEEDKGEDGVTLNLDQNTAEQGILQLFEDSFLAHEALAHLIELGALGSSLNGSLSRGLRKLLDELDSELSFEVDAFIMNVHVAAHELIELPIEMISEMRITAEVRNYTWSQVDEKDNMAVRQLTLE